VRHLGVQGGGGSLRLGEQARDVDHLDQQRAEAVLPLVSLLLGMDDPG
jgi:hypothetical protein